MRRLLPLLAVLVAGLTLVPQAALGRDDERPPEPTGGIVIVANPEQSDQVFRAVGAPEEPVVAGPLESESPAFAPTGGSCGGSAAVTANFVVNYTGFSAAAEDAFQCAVDILARRVISTVTIEIDATWTDMGQPNILGSAGHDYSFLNNRWHASALASAITGSDTNGSGSDMFLTFNSIFSWYLGFDGNAGGQYDFVTVVLHEITHGLGFASLMSVNGAGFGSWGGGTAFSDIYDTFVVNGANQSLINTSLFPNPSIALGNQLKSNSVWFSGPNTNAANGGSKASLYAPAVFNGGSSISHLGEVFNGTINALMTYSVAAGEADHDLGPVVKGVLKDIGWQIAEFSLDFTQEPANGVPGILSPQPTVAVEDYLGNTLTSDNVTQVTLSLIGTGTLTCTGGLTKTVVAGIATFAGCQVASAGTYQVHATATAVIPITSSDSASFTLAPATSYHLEFTQQPGSSDMGVPLTPQPVVAVKDASNATNTSDNSTTVTLSLQAGTGTLTCTGGLTKTVASGVATFSGCSVDSAGAFFLRAAAVPGTTASADSSAFNVIDPSPDILRHQLSAVAIGTEVAVFGRNVVGGLWYRETSGGTFGGWSFLGLSGAASRPEAVVHGSDLLVFYRGVGNDLRYYQRTAGVWSDHSLGGVLVGFPVAAVDGDGDLVVVSTDATGQPYSRVRSAAGVWAGWEAMGGVLSTRLDLVAYNGDVWLIGLNPEGTPWVRPHHASTGLWGTWSSLGGTLASIPASAVHGGSLYFVGTNAGGVTWYRALTGTVWGPWNTLGGILGSFPDVAATAGGLVYAGTSALGPAWNRVHTGAWSGWESLGGVLGAGPELAATPTTVYLFGLAGDGSLWYRTWQSGWTGWVALGGVLALE
jgi:hypothetical protein